MSKNNTKLIRLESVLADVYRLIDPNMGISEDDILESAASAMSHLYNYKIYEKAMCVRRVCNYKAALPTDFQSIESVMYTLTKPDDIEVKTKDQSVCVTCTATATDDCISADASTIVTYTASNCNDDGEFEVTKKELFELLQCNCWNNWGYLMIGDHPATLAKICDSSPNLGCVCHHSFSLKGGMINTSFEEGYIAITYRRPPKDNEGKLLIPNLANTIEAIKAYVFMEIYQKKMHMSHQGAEGRYERYKLEWGYKFAEAMTEQMMPNLPEWYGILSLNTMIKNDPPSRIFSTNNSFERINLK